MTLRQLLSECLEEGRSDTGMDPLKSPSQVIHTFLFGPSVLHCLFTITKRGP